jgi:hypothetical protein
VNLPPQADPSQVRAELMLEPTKSGKKRKKKKKKKKKDGLLVRAIERLLVGSAAAIGQMGDAVSGAADKYGRKHAKSREKRRGGWKRDLGRNLAGATKTLVAGYAKAPTKFAKALLKKAKKKRMKDSRAVMESTQSTLPTVGA